MIGTLLLEMDAALRSLILQLIVRSTKYVPVSNAKREREEANAMNTPPTFPCLVPSIEIIIKKERLDLILV